MSTDTRRVELHTHSTASDGMFPPARVAELVASRDVDIWALTDHDTCEGCEAAEAAARDLGLEFIPGIEISAYRERSIHVLGLGVDPEAAAMADLHDRLREARRDRMEEMVERLSGEGVSVSMAAIRDRADGAPLSRSHLADVLVASGAVPERDDAFDKYIGVGDPAYVPVGWPTVPTAIDRIHRSGGAAILAHPGRYDVQLEIETWADGGLDGLEASHPDHTPEQERHLRDLAGELDLIATEGSDFHGRGDDWAPFGDVQMASDSLSQLRASMEGSGAESRRA